MAMTMLFNGWKLLPIFTKSSVSDVQRGPESPLKYFVHIRSLKLYKIDSFTHIFNRFCLECKNVATAFFKFPQQFSRTVFFMAASILLNFFNSIILYER